MCLLLDNFFIVFFKQKTAYEMRISDWSSDVCSSDLVLRPAGRQRSARPPNISMFPRQLPSVSTSPSAGAPGSSTTGSSSIGFAAVSMQAFGEQLGTPPLASVSHAYCEPSGQDDAPPGSGAHDARSIGHCPLPPCIPTQPAVSPASSARSEERRVGKEGVRPCISRG